MNRDEMIKEIATTICGAYSNNGICLFLMAPCKLDCALAKNTVKVIDTLHYTKGTE